MAKTNNPNTTTDLPEPDSPTIEANDGPRITDDEICHRIQQHGTPFIGIREFSEHVPYSYVHTSVRLRELADDNRLTRVNTNTHNRAYYALAQIDASEFNRNEHVTSTGNINVDSPDTREVPVQDTLSEANTKYEQYWRAVDAYRFLGPALLNSDATKNDPEDSPLASAYLTARNRRVELCDKCRDLPGSLPEYRDTFDTPQLFDARLVTDDELEQHNISLDPEDDPIFLPTNFTLPATWNTTEADTDSDSSDDTTDVSSPGIPDFKVEDGSSHSVLTEPETETVSLSVSIDISIEVPTDADITIDDINVE